MPRSQPQYAGFLRPCNGVRYLTIKQVCTHLHVSRRSVYNWLEAGRLQWFRTPGGSLRIAEHSLWGPPAVAHQPPILNEATPVEPTR